MIDAEVCLRGHRDAATLFVSHYHQAILEAARRVDYALADDIAQEVETKLLIGNAPRLAQYRGQGSLLGWIKVVTVRLALDIVRKATAQPTTSLDDEPMLWEELERTLPWQSVAEGERDYLRAWLKPRLSSALRGAFTELDPQERNLLRYVFVEQLSIDALAGLLAVHRATAARRVANAKEKLARLVRKQLAEQGLDHDRVESVLRVVWSQLELSVLSALG